MKMKSHLLPASIFACLLAFIFSPGPVGADNVREPVWAGLFYPSSGFELKQTIDRLTGKARKTRIQIPDKKSLKAVIMPHAGYVYSGWTAAHVSLVLQENQFSKVILMGPDHRVGFKNGAISDAESFKTPLGSVILHEDAARLRRSSELFRAVPASDKSEHSLEVILPFLQQYLKEFKLVPIVFGPGNISGYSDRIIPLLDNETLLVASSDLSHFLTYSEAVARDRETINMILNLESDKLIKDGKRACGLGPILVIVDIARQNGWQPVLLHYSNSGDTAGDRSSVVGYSAIAFYGDSSMRKNNDSDQKISEQQGRILVKLARKTIMNKLGKKLPEKEAASLADGLKDKDFSTCSGTFVTLKIKGMLRGCIGNLSASVPISDGIKGNAVNAAFNDYRFSPLTLEEFDDVDIEVSILTVPQPLEYSDAEDLISLLRVNVDGVIIRKGLSSATFLPQVWNDLPDPKEFLSRLCHKAGLSTDAWRTGKLEVSTYQVQKFKEE